MCKFAIMRKNDAFVAIIVNTRLTKIFMAIFALDERLPTSATLNVYCKFIFNSITYSITYRPIDTKCLCKMNVWFWLDNVQWTLD